MLEAIAMISVLAGMGIYFIKSTDLPKDLKERSARLEQESRHNPIVLQKKYAFDNINSNKKISVNAAQAQDANEKLLQEKKLERKKLVEKQIKRIDELTMIITGLEQELKINNEKKLEIEAQIELHLSELIQLKQNKLA